MRYFRPKSLTWWAGLFLIVTGVMQAAGWPSGWSADSDGLTGALSALTAAVASLAGGLGEQASPVALIGLGAGLIGFRDAQHRNHEEVLASVEAMGGVMALMEYLDAEESGDPHDFESLVMNDPPGENPVPDGVVDPYGPGGSR